MSSNSNSHDDLMKQIKDRAYERYRSSQHHTMPQDDKQARAPYIRRLIRKHFPPDRDAIILDLGCGSGTLVHFLMEAGYRHVSGVDASPEQVATAKDLGISGVRQADFVNVLRAINNETLDVVVAFDVIEHLTKTELWECASEASRALKGGGLWIIHAPNAEGLFGSRVRYADWTHEQAFTKESLEQLLKLVGFEQVHCYEDQPIVHGPKSALRWLIWKVVRGVLRVCWMAETGSTGQNCIFSQNLLTVAIKEGQRSNGPTPRHTRC